MSDLNPSIKRNADETLFNIKITGVNTIISSQIMLLYTGAILSALAVAMVFGVISPKMRTTTVMIPVAMLTAELPKSDCATIVASAEAEMFTRLLPIRTALSILAEFSRILRTLAALLLPSSASERIRMRLTETNDVSADEKNDDRAISTTSATICIATLGSKVSTPLNFFMYMIITFIYE